MEISDGLVADGYGDRMSMNMLFELLTEQVKLDATEFADFLEVDPSEVLERVLPRYRVDSLKGVVTIIDRVQSVDKDGKRIFLDRDIVAGAIGYNAPGRALSRYVRNKVRETARSVHRRTQRARLVPLTSIPEPVGKEAVLDEDVKWLREELDRLPPDVRAALLEYYAYESGTQEEVAASLGTTRDRLQTLLERGCRALQHRFHAMCVN